MKLGAKVRTTILKIGASGVIREVVGYGRGFDFLSEQIGFVEE